MACDGFSDPVLKSKFRGCMIGGLIGDCVGEPFEGEAFFLVPKKKLSKFMNKLMNEGCREHLRHSDDTRMTISVASSLIYKREINAKDMAERFVDEYYREPHRGYGLHVRHVFKALKKSKCNDVFLPAKSQFSGVGSWGNGAAMRVAPIALFGNSRGDEFIMKAARDCSLITHAHPRGYNGAILQCFAVKIALGLDPSLEFDPVWFIDSLIEKMKKIERSVIKPYCEYLKVIKECFLEKIEDVSPKEIAKSLGNGYDVSALKSVPPAIYSFLRGMKPFKGYYENSNPFLRTIFFAVAIGGDTDTIASMAGSIAGAYYGEDMIPKELQNRCESLGRIILLANQLFNATCEKAVVMPESSETSERRSTSETPAIDENHRTSETCERQRTSETPEGHRMSEIPERRRTSETH